MSAYLKNIILNEIYQTVCFSHLEAPTAKRDASETRCQFWRHHFKMGSGVSSILEAPWQIRKNIEALIFKQDGMEGFIYRGTTEKKYFRTELQKQIEIQGIIDNSIHIYLTAAVKYPEGGDPSPPQKKIMCQLNTLSNFPTKISWTFTSTPEFRISCWWGANQIPSAISFQNNAMTLRYYRYCKGIREQKIKTENLQALNALKEATFVIRVNNCTYRWVSTRIHIDIEHSWLTAGRGICSLRPSVPNDFRIIFPSHLSVKTNNTKIDIHSNNLIGLHYCSLCKITLIKFN